MTAKRAILFVPAIPEMDRESGYRRLFDFMRFLKEDGWSLAMVALRRSSPRYERLMQQFGTPVFYGDGEDVKELIAAGEFHVAIGSFWHIAERFLQLIDELSPETRFIVDSVDLHLLRKTRETFSGGVDSSPALLDRALGMQMARELNTYARADAVLTVSDKEAALINDFLGADVAFAVPDSEDVPLSPYGPKERSGIVFVGNYRHPPNVAAVRVLCEEVLPLLDPALLALHEVFVIGNGLDDRVRDFCSKLPHVHPIGWVPSLVPYLHRAKVAVAPVPFGAGTKRKMIQSLMGGTPTVGTTVAIEGLGLQHERDVLVADDSSLFAAEIQRLLTDDVLWARLASEGRRKAESTHSRAEASTQFERVLTRALEGERKQWASSTPAPSQNPYRRLVRRICDTVAAHVPPEATVLIVSKGDNELLQVGSRNAWHFPRGEDGGYAGYYPPDSTAAIDHLEHLRAEGAGFVVFPKTALWWFQHYAGLGRHLDERYEAVFRSEEICVIYKLQSPDGSNDATSQNVRDVLPAT